LDLFAIAKGYTRLFAIVGNCANKVTFVEVLDDKRGRKGKRDKTVQD